MSYVVIKGKLVKVKRYWNGKTNISGLVSHNVEIARAEARQKASEIRAKELKGARDGNCNRTACQKPGATWWNTGTRAYYCPSCAHMINHDGCRRYGEPDLCYPSQSAALAAAAQRAAGRTEGAW
jgi:hypothetical protein